MLTNRGTLANGDAGQDDAAAPDPGVVLDGHRQPKLDELDPGQDARVVPRGVDAHVRAELDPVANGHETDIKDGETTTEMSANPTLTIYTQTNYDIAAQKPTLNEQLPYLKFAKQFLPKITLQP